MRISLLIRYITNTDINSKYINNVAISQQLVSSGRVSAAISKGSSASFLGKQKDVTERLAVHIPYSGTLSRRERSGAERLRMDGDRYGIWTGDYLWDNFVFWTKKKSLTISHQTLS